MSPVVSLHCIATAAAARKVHGRRRCFSVKKIKMRPSITALIHDNKHFATITELFALGIIIISIRADSENSARHHYCVSGLRYSLILYILISHLSLLWHFHISRLPSSWPAPSVPYSPVSLSVKTRRTSDVIFIVSSGDCAVRTIF